MEYSAPHRRANTFFFPLLSLDSDIKALPRRNVVFLLIVMEPLRSYLYLSFLLLLFTILFLPILSSLKKKKKKPLASKSGRVKNNLNPSIIKGIFASS